MNKKEIKIEEGFCPKCGKGNLEYGSIDFNEVGELYYPWECKSCKATGHEYYTLTFVGHYNVIDKKGNQEDYEL